MKSAGAILPPGLTGSLLGILSLAIAEPVRPQQPTPAAPCQVQTFRGRVAAGDDYEVALSQTLAFRLDAERLVQNPAGWTIRIVPHSAPEQDYSMVATPPYRFANPRYVDTGYGVSAGEALAHTPRDFAFVATPEDYRAATTALDVLLWPYSFTDAEIEAAGASLDALPVYPASLSIEDGRASEATPDDPSGRIEWMAFRLEVCVPMGGR